MYYQAHSGWERSAMRPDKRGRFEKGKGKRRSWRVGDGRGKRARAEVSYCKTLRCLRWDEERAGEHNDEGIALALVCSIGSVQIVPLLAVLFVFFVCQHVSWFAFNTLTHTRGRTRGKNRSVEISKTHVESSYPLPSPC